MDLKEKINRIDREFQAITNEIIENKNNDNFYHKLEFNTNQLIDHKGYNHHVNVEGELVHMFEPLNNIKNNHCLYWFEAKNENQAKELIGCLNEYRTFKDARTVPPKNKNNNGNIIYVGVRRGGYVKSRNLTNITGRICQHLGYYEKGSTQGLQLFNYARNKNFDIIIKVVEFKGLEPTYLNTIEKLVSQRLEPLCGKH